MAPGGAGEHGRLELRQGPFYEAHGDDYAIRRVSRPESASPACGSAAVHAQEQAALLDETFAGLD